MKTRNFDFKITQLLVIIGLLGVLFGLEEAQAQFQTTVSVVHGNTNGSNAFKKRRVKIGKFATKGAKTGKPAPAYETKKGGLPQETNRVRVVDIYTGRVNPSQASNIGGESKPYQGDPEYFQKNGKWYTKRRLAYSSTENHIDEWARENLKDYEKSADTTVDPTIKDVAASVDSEKLSPSPLDGLEDLVGSYEEHNPQDLVAKGTPTLYRQRLKEGPGSFDPEFDRAYRVEIFDRETGKYLADLATVEGTPDKWRIWQNLNSQNRPYRSLDSTTLERLLRRSSEDDQKFTAIARAGKLENNKFSSSHNAGMSNFTLDDLNPLVELTKKLRIPNSENLILQKLVFKNFAKTLEINENGNRVWQVVIDFHPGFHDPSKIPAGYTGNPKDYWGEERGFRVTLDKTGSELLFTRIVDGLSPAKGGQDIAKPFTMGEVTRLADDREYDAIVKIGKRGNDDPFAPGARTVRFEGLTRMELVHYFRNMRLELLKKALGNKDF